MINVRPLQTAITTITIAVAKGDFKRARNAARAVWRNAGINSPVPSVDDTTLWGVALELLQIRLEGALTAAQAERAILYP